MTDIEKVIKGLNECIEHIRKNKFNKIPCWGNCQSAMIDALELLKEQEEETTFVYDEYATPTCEKCGFHPFCGYIPTIKWMRERGYTKCPRCGRSVKWE